MREYRGLTAKRSQIIAQGFSPGISPPQKCALKGRPIGTKRNKSIDAHTKNRRDCREVEASSLEPNAALCFGATREALRSRPRRRPRPRIRPRGVMEYWSVGVLRQLGIAPRLRGVGSAFRADLCDTSNPGLKPWAKICYPPRRVNAERWSNGAME
jgi:hypothetical protein